MERVANVLPQECHSTEGREPDGSRGHRCCLAQALTSSSPDKAALQRSKERLEQQLLTQQAVFRNIITDIGKQTNQPVQTNAAPGQTNRDKQSVNVGRASQNTPEEALGRPQHRAS